MNTFTWKADTAWIKTTECLSQAILYANEIAGRAITILAFTAFKVDGLWVVTITYK